MRGRVYAAYRIGSNGFGRTKKGILTIYAPSRRYREIALPMETEKRRVFDVAESFIRQREDATLAMEESGSWLGVRLKNLVPPELRRWGRRDIFQKLRKVVDVGR
jgi:hypothetical protein